MTDFNQYKDLEVFVIGSGLEALDYAMKLSKIARKVIIVNENESFDTDKKSLERTMDNPRIDMLYNTIVAKVVKAEKVAETAKVSKTAKSEKHMNKLKAAKIAEALESMKINRNVMATEIVLVNRRTRKFAFHKADPKDKKIGIFTCSQPKN